MKAISKYVLVFLIVFFVLFAFLLGAANIPDSAGQKRFEESGEYMAEHDTVTLVHEFAQSSRLDYYADCVTLSIAYYLHGEHPLESAMWANYYGNNSNMMNQYLLETVQTDVEPDQEYLRYWHGNAAAMRYLHLFWNIKTIYMLHTVLMAALILILLWILWKNGMRGEAVAFILAMVSAAVWIVPWCLEYTYAFLCMLVAAIIGTLLALRGKDYWIGSLFMITGMVTVFFDFLTTETLSLLIPLLLILRIQRKEKSVKQLWLTAVKYCAMWLIGYLGMWVMKWALASVILHIDVMPYVRGHIVERLNAYVASYYVTGNFYLDALVKNLLKIFPLEYGFFGKVLIFALVFGLFILPVALGRINLREKINGKRIALYAVLGFVPYVRYLVVTNHSFVHCFFTYRSQAATVLAICLIMLELVQRTPRKAVAQDG
ncbi:MAG: hypothetical protein IJI10_05205 [Eubacterium sp.]|nr:hypothetical protein [Eubacterium sp.]